MANIYGATGMSKNPDVYYSHELNDGSRPENYIYIEDVVEEDPDSDVDIFGPFLAMLDRLPYPFPPQFWNQVPSLPTLPAC